jgi:ABC-type branched-subunit amino acid transport system ATPase component/ABC-type branched-subunit amino acid transport system permease subunit
MTAVVDQTLAAVRDAARDARRAWGPAQTAGLFVVAVAAALPWFAPDWVHVDELAGWLYLALAATGLVVTVGIAGLPSLGQGAFMSIGAFATGLLVARAGWPAAVSVPVAVAVSLVAGILAGAVVVRLAPLFLAVSTWILTWLVVLVALAFPGVSGGAQGYVVDSLLSTTGHYELALALTALGVAAVSTLRRSGLGIRLRANRDRPAAAATLGVRGDRLLLGAFAASAAVAGLAGSLAVQLDGVTDPNAFGPAVSFKLLVAVLVGGASYACGGVVGVAVLGVIALVAHLWALLQVGSSTGVQPMLAAVLLLVVIGLGEVGVIPLLARLRSRVTPVEHEAPRPRARPRAGAGGAALAARGLLKRYGGVEALAGFDLAVAPGEVVGLVGANGSGKTTALRALAGALTLDAGEILLDGRPLRAEGPVQAAEAGVIRTLQRTATFGSLTVLENAIVGASLHTRAGDPLRVLAATPKSRAEAREIRAQAVDALRVLRLDDVASVPAERLDGFRQRLLMLAAALAARPRLLLLDEPSAGASVSDLGRLGETIREIRARGVSVVVVEHNLPFVRTVSDRVVVMADGTAALLD